MPYNNRTRYSSLRNKIRYYPPLGDRRGGILNIPRELNPEGLRADVILHPCPHPCIEIRFHPEGHYKAVLQGDRFKIPVRQEISNLLSPTKTTLTYQLIQGQRQAQAQGVIINVPPTRR